MRQQHASWRAGLHLEASDTSTSLRAGFRPRYSCPGKNKSRYYVQTLFIPRTNKSRYFVLALFMPRTNKEQVFRADVIHARTNKEQVFRTDVIHAPDKQRAGISSSHYSCPGQNKSMYFVPTLFMPRTK